jgi:hypothetical protein
MMQNKSRIRLFLTCLLLTHLVQGVTPSFARNKAEMVDIRVFPDDPALKASFEVRNCFTPEMEEAVWSGLVTTFRFLAVLEKPGAALPLVPDRIVEVGFEHSIKYDRLRNEFSVTLQEQLQRVRTTNDFNEAKQWMSEVHNLSLIPLWRLHKGETYQLSVKAELSKVRLPVFFRYLFFWVALWDFETDWQAKRFTY